MAEDQGLQLRQRTVTRTRKTVKIGHQHVTALVKLGGDLSSWRLQAKLHEQLAKDERNAGLSSQRELAIQVDKLKRMIREIPDRLHGFDGVVRTPANKVGKLFGTQIHAVNQQCKVVERLSMKLFEEAVLARLKKDGKNPLPKGPLKHSARKAMEEAKSKIHALSVEQFTQLLENYRQELTPETAELVTKLLPPLK